MLFLAPPSHISATLSTLPTLPQHAVTQAVRRDADDYALVPHYAEIVCSDDWPVQPFDLCVHRAVDNAPARRGESKQQALDAREQGRQQGTQQVSVSMLCIWAIFFYQLFSLLEECRRY